jgi:hypothetical protein
MEATAKTFVLTNKKTWRREVRVFVMNVNKKFEERLLGFTTEHRVTNKQRTVAGRNTAAEFVTSDPVLIDALYRDSAYGKDFTEKGDTEGLKKKPTLIINDKDRQIVALRGLFSAVGLHMDETLPYDVLKEQYEIHMSAISGKKTDKPQATNIPHTPVDVKQTIEQGILAARQKYEEDWGEPIPAIVANDLAFLDGLSNPAFDAQKYIEAKLAEESKDLEGNKEIKDTKDLKEEAPVNEKEKLHAAYFEKTGKKVPNMKLNDLAWIKAKIEE